MDTNVKMLETKFVNGELAEQGAVLAVDKQTAEFLVARKMAAAATPEDLAEAEKAAAAAAKGDK